MGKNKEMLKEWKKEIKEYEKLTLQQAQELYKRINECDNKIIKKQLRDKLIMGTLYVVYRFIETNGYIYMNDTSYDMNDIINATIEAWIKKLDSGKILNITSFRQIIDRELYNNINENIGIKLDIDPKEYLYYIKGFISLISDYIKLKEENPNFNYYDLVEYMKEKEEYYPLLRRVNKEYYELKQFENGTKRRNTRYENYLKEHINKYDITSFELLEGIIKSIGPEGKHLSKTKLYNIRTLIISNGMQYLRKNINNISYDNIEKTIEQKELRKILIDLINSCAGVTDYHRELILARMGFDEKPITLEQFAQEHGYNKEYAKQAEARMISKLRCPSRATKIKNYMK